MNPYYLQQCKNIVDKLYKNRASGPFREPVDPIELGIPDYLEVIKKPIDLGTIKKLLAQQEYQTLEQFVADVRLVWSNCLAYNRPGSAICKIAENLSIMFEDLLQVLDHSQPETVLQVEEQNEGEQVEGDSDSEAEEDEIEYSKQRGLSEYERRRLENIERNKEMMKSLGLDAALNMFKPKVVAVSPVKRKLHQKPTIQAPTRSSKRKKGFHSSPLFTAVREKNVEEIVKILSTNEGDSQINEKNGMNDETPLHLAVTLGNMEITKILLAQDNVDVDAQDIRGWTPLAIAKTNGFSEIAEVLKESGASPTESLDVFKVQQKKVSSRALNNFATPQAPADQNRCTCCHTCRTSLTLYPREYKACKYCPYIYCKNCFESKPFLKMSWEEAQKN
jgi:hypothetical protein